MFEFKITAEDGKARVGTFETPHGTVTTPVFMPVGTHGAVKGVSPEELRAVGSQIILGNTYHLYLRPGDELIAGLGGLHAFTGWDGPMLTDSGGFQVFSLGERGMDGRSKAALRTVSEEGITFQSHLDGSRHLFTPEKSLEIQRNLGTDIVMAFDQPVYGLATEELAREAMERSMRWLERSKAAWIQGSQALFGIVQGGIHTELHRQSAEFVSGLDLPGNAIGGLSVGEGKEEMWEAADSICSLLPEDKPRYFMGLGDPIDLIDATMRGVDMYDCVAPSRLARHGNIWQLVGEPQFVEAFWEGDTETLLKAPPLSLRVIRENLTNASYSSDPRTLLPHRKSSGLRELPQATLHHYLKTKEMLAYRVLTMHNIEFLHRVTNHMHNAVPQGKIGLLKGILH